MATRLQDLINEALYGLGWSRKDLARATRDVAGADGYSVDMINKILRDPADRVPGAKGAKALADALGIDAAELGQAANQAAAELRARNRENLVRAGREFMENRSTSESGRSASNPVDEESTGLMKTVGDAANEFQEAVLAPVSDLLARLRRIPDEALKPCDVVPGDGDEGLARQFRDAQLDLSDELRGALASALHSRTGRAAMGQRGLGVRARILSGAQSTTAGALGAFVGAAAGAAASGAAISAGGAAAVSSSAVIAGGAGAILAVPVLGVSVAVAALAVTLGVRVAKVHALRQEKKTPSNLDDLAQSGLQDWRSRAPRIVEVLRLGALAARPHLQAVTAEVDGDAEVNWEELSDAGRAAVARLAQIVIAGLSVIWQPITLAGFEVVDDGEDTLSLEERQLADRYIDFTLDQVLGQIVR